MDSQVPNFQDLNNTTFLYNIKQQADNCYRQQVFSLRALIERESHVQAEIESMAGLLMNAENVIIYVRPLH